MQCVSGMLSTMLYIIGLGNPGEKYQKTRHNIGWMVLDAVIERYEVVARPISNKYWQATVCTVTMAGQVVKLVYPQTYMNKSGDTIRAIVKDDPEARFIVVHDDVALPLGTVRISQGRGDGGHNGVRSVYTAIVSTDVTRVRIGIARNAWFGSSVEVPRGTDLPRFVLSNFSFFEQSARRAGIVAAITALEMIVTDGVETAMNHINRIAVSK